MREDCLFLLNFYGSSLDDMLESMSIVALEMPQSQYGQYAYNLVWKYIKLESFAKHDQDAG